MNPLDANSHDDDLAVAFDGQAARFEKAPVQTDPAALARLVAVADFPPDSLIFDAGCGPGLVSQALLKAGHRVIGVDLSQEMIDRAQVRCGSFGDRARFERRAIAAERTQARCDGAISRYVLHHVVEPAQFLRDQIAIIRPGGIVVVSDHLTDPHPDRAAEHALIERLRDRTHTRNLTSGGIVDLFAAVGLEAISLVEEPFTLDFDEWFDRGTPAAPKSAVRARLVAAPPIRGFQTSSRPDGRITIQCLRAIVRGVVPAAP